MAGAMFVARKMPATVLTVGSSLEFILPCVVTRLLGIPLMVRLGGHPIRDLKHDLNNYYQQKRFLAALRSALDLLAAYFVLYLATAYVVVSPQLALDLKQSGFERRTFLIPQALQDVRVESVFRAKETDVIDNFVLSPFTVTNLNYRSKMAGVIKLANALAKLNVRTKPLVVIGSGRFQQFLAEENLARNAPDSLDLWGWQDQPFVSAPSDGIFLYCSDHDYLPNTLIEALAMGIPSVVFKSEEILSFPGIRDHVFVAEAQLDLEECLAVLSQRDSRIRANIIQAGLDFCRENFSETAVADQWVNALKRFGNAAVNEETHE